MATLSNKGMRKGSHRIFSPQAIGDPAVAVCAGPIEILGLVREPDKPKGLAPMYRIRNLDNGMECTAFSDELSRTNEQRDSSGDE